MEKFFEWFVGFTDAEGSFLFTKQGNYYRFIFKISLHLDDIDTLQWIKDMLGFGKVVVEKSKAVCLYNVTKLEEMKLIINIFDRHPLKSTKLLNFLKFKEGYEIYINSNNKTGRDNRLEEIKSVMNKKRTNFQLRAGNKYLITPYWFLGFVEGEGLFSIHPRDLVLTFSITQATIDLVLMGLIKDFLNNLPSVSCSERNRVNGCKNNVGLYLQKVSKANRHDKCQIKIADTTNIRTVLIPFLDSLTWRSKKVKDYQDWKTILKIRDKEFHYIEEGFKLIRLIISQMNNRRLSTAGRPAVDRASVDADILRLLSRPSNYEKREDGIWIISENKYLKGGKSKPILLIDQKGSILYSFYSVTDCAKFLGKSRQTIYKWIQDSRTFLFKNKLVSFKKV